MKCKEYLRSFLCSIRHSFLQLSKNTCRLELNDSISALDTSMLTIPSIYPILVTSVLEHFIFCSAFTLTVLRSHFQNQNQGPPLVLEVRYLNPFVDVEISNLPYIAQEFIRRTGTLNIFPHIQSSCAKECQLLPIQDRPLLQGLNDHGFHQLHQDSGWLLIFDNRMCRFFVLCLCCKMGMSMFLYVNCLHTNRTLVFLSACRDLQTD